MTLTLVRNDNDAKQSSQALHVGARGVLRSADPTGTLSVRRAFMVDFNKRLATIRQASRKFLADMNSSVLATSSSRVDYLARWIDSIINATLLEWDGHWVEQYVRAGGIKGGRDAARRVGDGASIITSQGMNVVTALTVAETVGAAAELRRQMVRSAAAVTLQNGNPRAIGRQLAVAINKAKPRLLTLVNTAVVSAHATASLATYAAAGITRVGVEPELVPARHLPLRDARRARDPIQSFQVGIQTAGDDKVCPDCEELEAGGPYELAEALGMIPAHPHCRCAWVPWEEELSDAWKEEDHPRVPVGSAGGGQFGTGGSSGSVDLKIDGLPANVVIHDDALKQAIARQVFDIKATPGRQPSGYEPGYSYDLTVSAKVVGNAVPYRRRPDDNFDDLYDPRFAELRTEDAGTVIERTIARIKSGVQDDLTPLDGDVIYRGISFEEFENINRLGYVESLGEYNIGEAQKGLTYWTTEIDTAAYYANGFAPWQFKATFDKPAIVIAMRRPVEIREVKGTGENEVGVARRVMRDEIIGVWKGDVATHRPGQFELRRIGYSNNYKIGSGSSPSTQVVWSRSANVSDAWEEEKHPRVPGGSTSGGQFGTAGSALEKAPSDRGDWPAHVQTLRIPPAWTDVRINRDPAAALQVVGRDAKGRAQYVYSEEFTRSQAAAKFDRIKELDAKAERITKQVLDDAAGGDAYTVEHAEAAYLIMKTGIRPGSADDTSADKQAYGATTLEGRHVGTNGRVLKFTGKSGVDLTIQVGDRDTAVMLARRAARAGATGRLFPAVTQASLLDYTGKLDGGGFKTKDFRTLLGTRTAADQVAGMPTPNNKAAFKKAVKAVAVTVASVLGNTPTVALNSYINPAVFAPWRAASGAV